MAYGESLVGSNPENEAAPEVAFSKTWLVDTDSGPQYHSSMRLTISLEEGQLTHPAFFERDKSTDELVASDSRSVHVAARSRQCHAVITLLAEHSLVQAVTVTRGSILVRFKHSSADIQQGERRVLEVLYAELQAMLSRPEIKTLRSVGSIAFGQSLPQRLREEDKDYLLESVERPAFRDIEQEEVIRNQRTSQGWY